MKTKPQKLDWARVNEALMKAKSHEAVFALLRTECAGQRRHSFLNRLFGRYTTLRTEYERKQMFAGRWPT